MQTHWGRKSNLLQPSTVVCVPSTKSGILAKKLRENEEKMSKKTGFKIKFQEAGGTQLKNLFSTDLWKESTVDGQYAHHATKTRKQTEL